MEGSSPPNDDDDDGGGRAGDGGLVAARATSAGVSSALSLSSTARAEPTPSNTRAARAPRARRRSRSSELLYGFEERLFGYADHLASLSGPDDERRVVTQHDIAWKHALYIGMTDSCRPKRRVLGGDVEVQFADPVEMHTEYLSVSLCS